MPDRRAVRDIHIPSLRPLPLLLPLSAVPLVSHGTTCRHALGFAGCSAQLHNIGSCAVPSWHQWLGAG